MILSTRNLVILDYLHSCKKSSIKNIASKFNISESSARYDLKNINKIIKNENIGEIEFLSKGAIYFNCFDDNKYMPKIQNYKYLFTSKERIEFIEMFILFQSYPFNIQRIIEKLNISRNTFKNDFKKIKHHFMKMGIILNADGSLKIKRGSARTYIIILLSKYIRKFFFQPKIYKYLNKFIFDNALKYVTYDKINIIIEYVKDVLQKTNRVISDDSYQMFIAYIIIVVETISNGSNSINKIDNELFFKTMEEFNILNSSKYILEDNFHINVNDIEVVRLTSFLLGSSTYTKKIDFYENWIRSEIFIERFIREVSIKSGYDMTLDSVLFNDISHHLKPAIYRIKNKISLENSIYDELIEKEEKLFNIVKSSINKIENIKEISNDEIAYLVVYFKSSIDRINVNNIPKAKKNVLIICNFGYGTSKLLAQNLIKNYNINIKDTIPFYELDKYSLIEDIDCIVTTANLKYKNINIPIIKVNPILEREDFIKLDNFGFTRNQNRISLNEIYDFFSKEFYYYDADNIINKFKNRFYDFIIDDYIPEEKKITLKNIISLDKILIEYNSNDWKESIKKLGKTLVVSNCVDISYIDSLINIVEEHGTYMVIDNMYGIFHANNNNNIFKTSLALMLSKETIRVKDKSINLILILASKNRHEHLNAIIQFSAIFDNKKNLEKLISLNTSEEIYNFLNQNS